MSTNASISLKTKTGDIRTVYCHCDGYPKQAGALLEKHYDTYDKVLNLIEHGDMSSLHSKIDPDPTIPHDFENRQNDVCIFYARDCGETGVNARTCFTEKQMLREEAVLYNYLFENNRWKII